MTRHLAIGDIHGCIGALGALIDYVAPGGGDTIVTLGDYVDRGPDSRAVLDLVIELDRTHTLIPLRGNHEIMMLDARARKSWLRPWLNYGGDATLRSYSSCCGDEPPFFDIPGSHIEFLENRLVPYYECDSHFFVHANADPAVALDNQSDATRYWRKLGEPEKHRSGKIMVCGHSQQESGIPFFNGNAICIDTWAYHGGWLSCLDVESETIFQANETGERRQLALEDIRIA